jgi:hypothetical protein
MPEREIPRDEAEAALQTRLELGREYEPAIVDSFVDRIDRAIEQRVSEEVARRVRGADETVNAQARAATERSKFSLALAIVSLGISIPLTAISAALIGMSAVIFVWVAIVMVNLIFALGSRGARRR